ncbi:MAG: hypothetical protein IJ428_02875 [Clostridia bacterium]|nr:hypothetical protein [Clostridia bacterium]
MDALYELKDKLCRELDEFTQKPDMSAFDLETVHKLTDTIKNIDKIVMLEGSEDGGYSRDDGMDTSKRGRSYAKGGRGGDYSNGGYSRNEGGYSRGDSYANRGKHYVRGHYSRDDGRDHMMEQLEDMMSEAGSEYEREAIKRCIDQMRGV